MEVKKRFLRLVTCVSIIGMSFVTVFAASSLTQKTTVSAGFGSAVVQCKGTYYPSGNTRWSRTWGTVSTSGLKSTYITSTMSVPTDKLMNTTGTINMTGNDYQSKAIQVTFKYKYNGSSVVKN